MSYDASIEIDTGRGKLYEIEEIGNYTCNVGPMFRAAMPEPHPRGGKYNGVGDPEPRSGLPGVSGLSCVEALPILTVGVRYMEDHADEMRAMNPPNGWGEYSSALDYLRRCRDACARHPLGTFCVNW